jgi:hypothetical protein
MDSVRNYNKCYVHKFYNLKAMSLGVRQMLSLGPQALCWMRRGERRLRRVRVCVTASRSEAMREQG